MATVVYLIRHSTPMNNKVNVSNTDSLQIENEKTPLSVKGEEKAKTLSLKDEMKNVDLVISSNYVRAISTAKYIAHQNDKDVIIMNEFNERKYGVDSWDEKPKNFDQNQITDKHLKMPNGESKVEVADRMNKGLIKVLNDNKGKKVVIVSHATAITFLLMKLGKYENDTIFFNDEKVIDKSFVWDASEIFKLTFKDNNLVKIENVR